MALISSITLDLPGTSVRDDAISVEECSKHKNCNRIGMHIFLVDLQNKIHFRKIPTYGSAWKVMKPGQGREFRVFGFAKDKQFRAMSTFVHTNFKHAEGPVENGVVIRETYEFGQLEKCDKRTWHILWQYFIGDTLEDKWFNTDVSRYLLMYPKLWREVILVDCLTKKYDQIIKNHIVRKLKNAVFITREEERKRAPSAPDTHAVTVFKDEFDSAKTFSCEDDNFKFLSRVFECLKPIGDDGCYFPQRYKSDVESSLGDRSVVQCGNPLRAFKEFLNQQILIHSMQKSRATTLYSKEDLLGLLVPRFREPTLAKGIFKRFSNDGLSIMLGYFTERHVDPSLSVLKISTFVGKKAVGHKRNMNVFYFNGLYCTKQEKYCNRDLIQYSYKFHEELKTEWSKAIRNCTEKSKTKVDKSKILGEILSTILQKIDQEESGVTSPYQYKVDSTRGPGTKLAVKRGAELQMQISLDDVKNNGISLGLRMLRIGQNCHLCFTHVNYPEKAFMSDRSDVRQLITNERIIALQQATTDDVLSNSKHVSAEIEWYGDYMGGGSFQVNDVERVAVKDLLCIRKEIFGIASNYIWCCHGIVTKKESVEGHKVQFATCTLSQTEVPPREGNFCITVIYPTTIESAVLARKRRNSM